MPLSVQRALLAAGGVGVRLPPGTVVVATTLGGRPAERVQPAAADGSRAVLLLHGGAFQTCSPRTHRSLAAHVAAAAGCDVWVLDYRRAPEHPYPVPVDDAIAAFDDLARAHRVSVLGDSAGGTLALLLARVRRPTALALISPLVDLTLRSSDAFTGRDPLLRRGWLAQGTSGFLGAADVTALSPLLGELTGLPPLLVHVSEHECLRPEGQALAERVTALGGDARLEVLPGLWHDVHLFAHLVPEAAAACASIGDWIRAPD